MSTEELKKALGKRAKFLGNIVQSFENHNQVHFQSGYVAHKDDKLLLIEDVLDVLDDYVVVPRKQLFDKCAYVDFEGKPAIVCNLCRFYHGLQKGCSWEEEKKELLEATQK